MDFNPLLKRFPLKFPLPSQQFPVADLAMKTRKDAAHIDTDLSYPTKPDNKGYARKTYAQRLYYFGQHNTPESFVLFGEWRKRLIATGEAPDVKSVKAELKQEQAEEDLPQPTVPRHMAMLAICLIVAVLSSAGTWIVSNGLDRAADEFTTSLTDEEMRVIEGMRRQHGRVTAIRVLESVGDREARIATRTAALMEVVNNGTEASKGRGS